MWRDYTHCDLVGKLKTEETIVETLRVDELVILNWVLKSSINMRIFVLTELCLIKRRVLDVT